MLRLLANRLMSNSRLKEPVGIAGATTFRYFSRGSGP